MMTIDEADYGLLRIISRFAEIRPSPLENIPDSSRKFLPLEKSSHIFHLHHLRRHGRHHPV